MADGPMTSMGSLGPEIDPLWLIKAITRLETKMDTILQLEARVTLLEKYKAWLSGAVAMAGAVGAMVGWYIANATLGGPS